MTLTDVSVSPFDPRTATPQQRLSVGQLRAEVFAVAYPDDPPLLAEKEALELGQQMPDEGNVHFVVWEGTRATGWASLNYHTQQNLHLAHARLVVHPERRRQGLGRALAAQVTAVARREARRTVMFVTSDRHPGSDAFARGLGAQAALPTRQSRLELAGVDVGLLARWLARPDGEPYRSHLWEGRLPDTYLERIADLMMVMNSAPKGELDMDDWLITPEMIRGWEANSAESGVREVLIAVEDTRSGELVGLTDVSWRPERAAIIHQGATAVRPAARGQGLGKQLKALMVQYLTQHAPEAQVIQTSNAEENAAMLGINVALGFKPWVAVTEWQLKLE